MRQIKRRRGADAWRALVVKFAHSGLSVQAFCRQEGISTSTFSWWRCRFSGSGPVQPVARRSHSVVAGEFVDLGRLSAPASQAERLELRLDLGGGLVLQLVRG
jgi:putative transposase